MLGELVAGLAWARRPRRWHGELIIVGGHGLWSRACVSPLCWCKSLELGHDWWAGLPGSPLLRLVLLHLQLQQHKGLLRFLLGALVALLLVVVPPLLSPGDHFISPSDFGLVSADRRLLKSWTVMVLRLWDFIASLGA